MNEPQKMTVEELLVRNPIKRPTEVELEEWDYDIKAELESFSEKRETPTFLDINLIRHGFKYNEEESWCDDASSPKQRITKIYEKDIDLLIQASKLKINHQQYKITITIGSSDNNQRTDQWIEYIGICMYKYIDGNNELENSPIISEVLYSPKKLKDMSREIYLFKKLKYILDTLK